MAKLLQNAAEILSVDDRKYDLVPVPEWGGEIRIRSMSAAERDGFDSSMRNDEGKLQLDNYRARLAAACICDEAGTLLFVPKQAAELGRKNSVVLTRIVKACESLNGMNREAVDAAKKDSGTEASDASPTDSPSPAANGT